MSPTLRSFLSKPSSSSSSSSRQMASRGCTQTCLRCGATQQVPSQARNVRCLMCRELIAVSHPHLVRSLPKVLSAYSSSASYGYSGSFSSSYMPLTRWQESFPPSEQKKRAVLIGVTYAGKRYQLKGTVNDVNCMKYFLTWHVGFPEESIIVLTEEQKNPSRIPTRQNIEFAMQWLIHGVSSDHSLFFHFSGHGSQRLSRSGDENDGFDETLCPLDYESQGMIVDDEINATLVRPLPKGAKLHAIVDSCHSGTVLDLPYLCRLGRTGYQWEDHSGRSGPCKGTSGGLAVSFSGCDDHQTSADTSVFTNDVATGAMTYCFIQAVISNPRLTYGTVLNAMRATLRDADTSTRTKGPISALLNQVFNFGSNQEPQLASSEKFDIYRRPFII